MMKKIVLGSTVALVVLFAAFMQKLGLINSSQSNINNSTNNNTNFNQNNTRMMSPMHASYKDGEYIGNVADAFYGYYQVKAVISGGKLTDVQFLQYPNDAGHSIEVNSYANPILKQEAINSQNANVDVVSGATQSSLAFRESLQSALNQAI